MAKKDKKLWEELFYNRFGYQPALLLHKKKAKKATLYDLFEIANEIDQIFSIHLIFPFDPLFPMGKEPVESVVIFPQTIRFDKVNLYEISEPILCNEKLYSLEDFISKCPPLDKSYDPSLLNQFTFSSSIFIFSTDELSKFKKLYLTPIKKMIVEAGCYSEPRGQSKPVTKEQKERNDFIIKRFKALGEKKPLPIERIQDDWADYLDELYPNMSMDELNKRIELSNITIRRVIDAYLKE